MFNYDKLEKAIKESGKTKTYLCQKMNRPAYYLRDVLKQKNAIPSEQQRILADELGVTVEWLNDEETEKPATISGNRLDSETQDFIRLYQNAPSWIQDQVRSLLEAAESNRATLDVDSTKQ